MTTSIDCLPESPLLVYLQPLVEPLCSQLFGIAGGKEVVWNLPGSFSSGAGKLLLDAKADRVSLPFGLAHFLGSQGLLPFVALLEEWAKLRRDAPAEIVDAGFGVSEQDR